VTIVTVDSQEFQKREALREGSGQGTDATGLPERLPMIAATNLGYTYPDGTRALANVSFALRAGERLVVLGANGAGKSTLLLLLAGLIFGEGEVRARGELLTPRRWRAWRGRVGIVFQDPDDQLFMPTVLDDVMFGPRNQGLGHDAARARAEEALAAMGVEHLAKRPPHRLSLGQKRRVAIAGVLAMRPEILALDEPAAGLDPRGRGQLVTCLNALDVTLMVATHDLNFARRVGETALVLKAGEQLAHGPLEEILADDVLLRKAGLTEE
jgi:cobalt/nickel transport system ATP-binding protein